MKIKTQFKKDLTKCLTGFYLILLLFLGARTTPFTVSNNLKRAIGVSFIAFDNNGTNVCNGTGIVPAGTNLNSSGFVANGGSDYTSYLMSSDAFLVSRIGAPVYQATHQGGNISTACLSGNAPASISVTLNPYECNASALYACAHSALI